MTNVFSEVVKGFKWLGKKIGGVSGAVKRVVTISRDVEADAGTLLPEVVTLIEDIGVLTAAIVKDGGTAFTELRALSAAVIKAYADKGTNFAEDVLVVTTLKVFGEAVIAHGTWLDVISAGETTAKDFDQLGNSATAALKKLEAEA